MKQDVISREDAEVILSSQPKDVQRELKRRIGQLYLEGRYDKKDLEDC